MEIDAIINTVRTIKNLKEQKKYIIFSVLITIGMCLFTTISLFAIEQDKATNYTEAIKMMNAAIIDCYLIFQESS